MNNRLHILLIGIFIQIINVDGLPDCIRQYHNHETVTTKPALWSRNINIKQNKTRRSFDFNMKIILRQF